MSAEQWVDRAIEAINYNWVRSGVGRTADQSTAQRQTILGVNTINPNFMIDDRWTQPGHPGLQYVDWQDLVFRKGVIQNYEINASGGTDAVTYFVSAGYLDQQGTAIGLGYKRFSARANIEIKANDRLKFGLNVAPSYAMASDPGVEGKDQQLHIAVSQAPVVEANVGPYNTNIGPNTNYLWGQTRNSPMAVIEQSIGDTRTFRTLSTVFGEYKLVKGLAFRTSLNFDITNGNVKKWTPAEVTGSGPTARATTGSLAGSTAQNFVNENTLTYTAKLGEKHNITLLAGTSFSTFKYDTWSITGSKFASDVITTLNAATQYNSTSTESKSVLLSYFGRANYTFNNRYLFSASLRRDGSSRFGNSTKWGVFPSASVGWIVSDEGFMQGIGSTLSNLKVRASWGKAGNNVIPTINNINGDYAAISLLQFSNTSFGGKNGAGVRGMTPQNFANPDLSWETSTTINIGVDFGLIQNRINASLDYYTKDNTDLLLNIPVPIASGFSSALTNIGEVVNKGWEVELHTRNLTGKFQWNTDINFSQNTNEVKKLGPGDTPILDNGGFDIEHKITRVGYPINSLYLVRQIGVLSPEDIANGYPVYNKQEAGDPKYLDASGPNGVPDGVIDANDRVILGSPNPKYIWGIANTFKFQGFDLNVLVQGQNGGYIYSLFGRAIDRTGQGTPDNTLAKYANRWRSPDDRGTEDTRKWPSTFGRIKNTDWLYSNDYVRVRNITLGYNLGALLKTKAISAARIYVTAENWFGHDKYYGGFNPEGVNTNGEDYGAYPLSKSIIIGANLTF
jgi:TonB-linked SusC/RagA family outer membrane protein